jgi:hypothetical protein
MKLLTIISAGLVAAAASAQAQSPAPGDHRYTATSDLRAPYAEMPPAEGPAYGYAPSREGPNGYGPRLLPVPEVYTVLREHGFSARGMPRQHGFFYTIAVTDRRGDNGRLVIDARNGRIARFVPAYRWGPGFGRGPGLAYGPSWRMPPMAGPAPRPPASVPVPKLASRTPSAVPLPKPDPVHTGEVKPEIKPDAKPLAEKPTLPERQQSAANQAKPAEAAPAPTRPPPAPVEAKPATPEPEILPTQEMPKVQGFE